MLRASRLTAEDREGLLSVCCVSFSKKEVAEAVEKELKFRPGREVMIWWIPWLCLLAPLIVPVQRELGDKMSGSCLGYFRKTGVDGGGGGVALHGFPLCTESVLRQPLTTSRAPSPESHSPESLSSQRMLGGLTPPGNCLTLHAHNTSSCLACEWIDECWKT